VRGGGQGGGAARLHRSQPGDGDSKKKEGYRKRLVNWKTEAGTRQGAAGCAAARVCSCSRCLQRCQGFLTDLQQLPPWGACMRRRRGRYLSGGETQCAKHRNSIPLTGIGPRRCVI
jgi:hypothetical protein